MKVTDIPKKPTTWQENSHLNVNIYTTELQMEQIFNFKCNLKGTDAILAGKRKRKDPNEVVRINEEVELNKSVLIAQNHYI